MALNGQISSADFCPLSDNGGQKWILARDGLSAFDPLRQFTSFRHRQMTHCGIDGLSKRLPGGTCTHWKAPHCHGTHQTSTYAMLEI